MKDLQTFKKQVLQNPELKREYDRLAPRYAVISELIAARLEHKMTQADVAKKVGTTQSSIARLEGGTINPSLDFLEKVAVVLGHKLTIHLA